MGGTWSGAEDAPTEAPGLAELGERDVAPSSAGPGDYRYNLFGIGRRRGDEVQLTRFLSGLWRREQEGITACLERLGVPAIGSVECWDVLAEQVTPQGRLDLLLVAPGQARIVIEAKIHAELGALQAERYIDYLARAGSEPLRALVIVSLKQAGVPSSAYDKATASHLAIIERRWEELAAALVPRDDEESLTADFVQMLHREGLAVPPPLTPADWDAWNRGSQVISRLASVIQATAAALSAHVDGLEVGVVSVDRRQVQCRLRSAGADILTGFSANPSSRHPGDPPIAWVKARPRQEGASSFDQLALEAAAKVSEPHMSVDGRRVIRHTRAEALLAQPDSAAQEAAYLAFCAEALLALARVDYLGRELLALASFSHLAASDAGQDTPDGPEDIGLADHAGAG